MRQRPPIAMDIPSAERDRAAWVKVAVIAAVGFGVGVAWPRLLGVKLGPTAPGSSTAATTTTAEPRAATPAPSVPASVATPAAIAASPKTAADGAASSLGAPDVHVGRPYVISCKNADNETLKGKECGAAPSGLDAIVTPRLQKLGSCGAAEGQTGKLSVVVTVDFNRGGVSHSVGKSSTVGNLDGIAGCLKTHFSGVVAKDVPHEHKRYVVSYAATFKAPAPRAAKGADTPAPSGASTASNVASTAALPPPGDDSSNDAPAPAKGAGGEATVAWEVALVRDVPKTGAIVARLPRGAKVQPGESKGGWYSIRFGDGFASQGWVYRGAIGR
jgi:hypothetical protein